MKRNQELLASEAATSQLSKGKPGIGVASKRGIKGPAAAAPVATGRRKGADQQEVASDSGVKPRSQSSRSVVGKLPQVVNKKARPASMHDTPKASAAAAGRGKGPEKRVVAKVGRGEDQVSGFKKLQMGVEAKRGGPVVVTFEDEDTSSVRGSRISPAPPGAARVGGARQSHLPVSKAHRNQESQELRGASEHLSIPSADMDGISDDQLDRLLMRARNARN